MNTAPTITSTGPYFLLKATYDQRDQCKSIPSARWVPTARCWRVDATPALAQRLATVFPDAQADEQFLSVLAASAAVVEAQSAREATEIDVPNLRTTPWLHQRRAYAFAAGIGGHINAMVMGTGKTLPMVALASTLKRTLVICPARVVSVWPGEFAKHCARPVDVAAPDKGDTTQRAAAIERAAALAAARGNPFVAVVNYESAWRGWVGTGVRKGSMADVLLSMEWDLVVLDESHRVKDAGGRASKFVRKLSPLANKRICLTGTPTPHNPLDIWAQMDFAARGVLHTGWAAFRHMHEVHPPHRAGQPDWISKQVLGYRDLDKLAEQTAPYIFRVGREVLDLPTAVHTTQYCDLEPEAVKTYRQIERQSIAQVATGEITAANALAKILRLQQITGGALPVDGDGPAAERLQVVSTAKQRLLRDILDDIEPDESVVVFCRFRHDLDAVHEVAGDSGRRSLELSGRCDDLAEFQQSAEPRVLAVQVQAGGVGVNLTKARYSIFYSLSYSLGEYDQALARCDRPGQTRSVNHIHLVARGTIDERIREALDERREVVEYVYQAWREKEQR